MGIPLRSTLVGLITMFAPVAAAATPSPRAGSAHDFVRVRGTEFEVAGKRYAYVGTNLWYGAQLDPARLVRELDRLAAHGVKNLRVMALTQGPDHEPWRIVPTLEPAPGRYEERELRGLDRLLAEMGKRGMRAVVCLGNFWPWSGGMSQYLNWAGAGPIPYPPPALGGDWDVYQNYTERFYGNLRAVELARQAATAVVSRVSAVTGLAYRDDPTIMAWQLANEPRGGHETRAFNEWIDGLARHIKRLDPRHLVTTGSEGETPWPATSGLDVALNHSSPAIDYVTAHAWAQNWSWFDPTQPDSGPAGLDAAIARAEAYLDRHARLATAIGKPLVLEEFGIGRDGGSYDPVATTRARDRYYGAVFARAYALAEKRELAGINFWAWAGEGRPVRPYGGHWRVGLAWIGDPPHEAQGWYSVYDRDASTLAVIRESAAKFDALTPLTTGSSPLRPPAEKPARSKDFRRTPRSDRSASARD